MANKVADAVSRVEEYLAKLEDATNWGGPPLTPEPPRDDLRVVVDALRQTVRWPEPKFISSGEGMALNPARVDALYGAIKTEMVAGEILALVDRLGLDDLYAECLPSDARNAAAGFFGYSDWDDARQNGGSKGGVAVGRLAQLLDAFRRNEDKPVAWFRTRADGRFSDFVSDEGDAQILRDQGFILTAVYARQGEPE